MLPRFDAGTVLQRMAQGAFAAHLAQDFGVSKQAVSKRLLRYSRQEYRQAMARGAAVRLLAVLRRIRDDGDIPREALKREILYCERWAAHLLVVHAALIRDAERRTASWVQHLREPLTGRPEPVQSPEVGAELDALERLYARAQGQHEQADS